jgi:predicted nucleic acid-binding protein
MNILVDSNVVLDALLARQPFCGDALKILALSEDGIFNGSLSASSVTDIYYIIRRERKSKEIAMTSLKRALGSLSVAAVKGDEIRRAIDLGWDDFEDAVQYVAGESIGVGYVVTRDSAGFTGATVPVVSPAAFLALITGG